MTNDIQVIGQFKKIRQKSSQKNPNFYRLTSTKDNKANVPGHFANIFVVACNHAGSFCQIAKAHQVDSELKYSKHYIRLTK